MRRLRSISGAMGALTLITALAGACGSSSGTGASVTTAAAGGGAGTTSRVALHGAITVLAASSLTKAFTALGHEFQAAHPGTTITFSFGSSSDLERQIEQGAPADAYASADQANMDKVVTAHDNAGAPVSFAKNKLEIAVEKGNPKRITELADLTAPGLVVVLCDPSVPCGKLADQVLANAKVKVTPKSREANVKATLSKVELGEADAALVYVSDVASSGTVEGVTIPDAVNVITTLPIVALKGSTNPALAQAWTAFVVAHERELVDAYGFVAL